MRRRNFGTLWVVLAAGACSVTAPAQDQRIIAEGAGARVFGTCGSCHGKIDEAPSLASLKKMTPEKVHEAITTGIMKAQAAHLSEQQKIDLAEWIGGRKLGSTGSGDAKSMANVCTDRPPVRNPASAPSWNGWSANALTNTRYQPANAAKLSPAAASRLQLKWAFGLPAASSAYGQPTVVDGRVFVGSDSGYLYSINAKTGCVYWSFQAQSGLRSTPMIGPVRSGSSQMAAYFGDVRGNMYAVDASNGELLWQSPIDSHPLSRITAGVKLYEGRVYVSVASLEEPESWSHNYLCCTFRGMVAALDSATGKQIWKTYTITEQPTPRKNAKGASFLGPSGAGVWGPVTLDPKRRAVYFSTGNAFSASDVGRSDAVMAVNMDTGAILWAQQAQHGDVWHSSQCGAGPPPPGQPPRSAGRRPASTEGSGPPRPQQRFEVPDHYYCPDEKQNPDWDFSAGVMLVDLPDGKSLVVAGQKSGMVWAHDPDQKGKLVWSADISRGQIIFGAAADDEQAYFAMRGGAVAAVRLSDGLEQWATWFDPQPSMQKHRGASAAVSLVPGAVFVPGLDGVLRAFSTFNGKLLWEYDTTPATLTVNGVEASGGSIGSAGAVIVDGMVYVTSGYVGFQSGQAGNLLLAFGQPED